MAVPESSKCPKCFATVPVGAATCPECGAPVNNASPAEVEAAIYPELAKANLARMRGDYKVAEDQLLSVLKRYPNHPSANEMLGDLAMEKEDYPHALQWYELALDLVPDSQSIARKLRDVRDRMSRQEQQDTTAQLGIPEHRGNTPVLVAVIVIGLIAVGVIAYMLGSRGPGAAARPQTPVNVISAPREPKPSDAATSTDPTPAGSHAEPSFVQEDRTSFEQLVQRASDPAAIMSVAHDPRSGVLVVTFALSGKEDRALAARVARDAFAAVPGAARVTLRGSTSGKIAYVADVSRERLAETEAPSWAEQHPNDPNAWIPHVLENEWPASEATTAQPPETQPEAGRGSTP